jgi:N-methylhydantoinase A/oxoprolinase/acetone carboxylase beta subunit
MTRYLRGLAERLSEAGFTGRLMTVTSQGGVIAAESATIEARNRMLSPSRMSTLDFRHWCPPG